MTHHLTPTLSWKEREQCNDNTPAILALDAGGSSTRSLLLRQDGTVLGRGRGGPANHILSGWETARASIAEAVGQACAAASLAAPSVEYVAIGSAGVGANGEGSEIVEAWLAELLPNARRRATGDMVTAFAGALSSDAGVVVAAGTGSVCYGRDGRGGARQVGGWGQIMGDEGSAYDIAVRALRAGAQATDGRGPATALTTTIPAALEMTDFMGVAFRVYGEPMTRDAIAQLATTVAETAQRGDGVAGDLLAAAGRDLAQAAGTALSVLGLSDGVTSVAYSGAVFDAGEIIVSAFRNAVTAVAPRAVVMRAEFPPVVGAFKLALQDLHVEFTAAIRARLAASMGERA